MKLNAFSALSNASGEFLLVMTNLIFYMLALFSMIVDSAVWTLPSNVIKSDKMMFAFGTFGTSL